MTALTARARRMAASRGPRVATALAAAALMAVLTASLTGAARQPITLYPVQAAFTPPGPYATTTGTVTNSAGMAIYNVFRPGDYAALGFKSPIVTWGNGTGASPAKVSAFLSHLASYGFTVIASTLPNTGSGNEIDAAGALRGADRGDLAGVQVAVVDAGRDAVLGDQVVRGGVDLVTAARIGQGRGDDGEAV